MKKPTEITYVPPIVTIAEIEIENGIAASPVDSGSSEMPSMEEVNTTWN